MITFDSPTKQASEDSADTSTLDRLRGLASPPKVSLSQQQFPSTQPFFASQAGLQWFSSQGSSQLQADHGLCGGGGGGTSVLGALGVNTDDTTLNVDPLFSANPYPRLPPIRTIPAPGASMHIRMCCYGFNVAKNVIMGGMTQEEVCDFVRSKVQTTQELLTGNPSSSVLLVDTPGHFFDEEKGLLWLVFKTKGTAVSRWESLGRSLESSQMNLISAHPLVKVGTRGFAHVVAHFGLSEKESNYLHCSTKIDIGFVKSETKPRRSPTASASGGDGGMVKDEPQDRGGSGGLDDGQQQQQKQDTKRGRYTEEDHDEEQASGEAAKHGKKKKKSKDAASTTPTTSMQARYKPVRSMTAGTPDELKTPKILQAVPAEDMGNDATLPVVRSLTGAFKDGPAGGDQPPSSPHRPKKVSRRTHDISSPPGNKGKSKAATGPSPNKRDHHQGKADDKSGPSIVPSTIVERCVHYISDAQSIETTLDFLGEFDGFARRAIGTASSANALEIIRNLSFEALNEFVILHSCLTKVLRERYCIPVENLTPTGIIPHHHNWTFLRDSDANGYAYLSEMLKNLIAGISDTFDKGVFLFDPVSISFFLGVQSLKLRLERQSRHNVFLQFACQDLAHDLKRLYATIHSLIMSLKYFTVDHEKVTQYAEMSVDEFTAEKLAPHLQEILMDPNVVEEQSVKWRRMLKFELMIKEVCKRYKIKYEPNVSIGKAHAIFKVMQESSSFFVTLDTSHENYETFTNVTHDIAAVETLYLRVYESKSLLPCGQGSSSSGSKR